MPENLVTKLFPDVESKDDLEFFDGENESGTKQKSVVKMIAPMVRYSKLPFRLLCRRWGCDLCFTPMIMAESFNRSKAARDSDFTTNSDDRPLVAQFAASDPIEFGIAALKCSKFVDGLDLNCGCPQKWAIRGKVGGYLSEHPELTKQMVVEARKHTDLPVSIKIRIQDDIRGTVDLVRKAEAAGVAWVTVHGRTVREKTKVGVHLDAIKTVKECATVPIIANGDVMRPRDIDTVIQQTNADGIMCARGILANPALFAGHKTVPLECVTDYISLALEYGGHFGIHHHHLCCMLKPYLFKSERKELTSLLSMPAVIEFFKTRLWWPPDGI